MLIPYQRRAQHAGQCGVEEGLLPVQSRGADLAEERRLFYVGLTRAQEEVVLFRAGARQRHGKRLQPAMAPFVGELPRELLVEADVAVPHQEKRVTQLSLLEAPLIWLLTDAWINGKAMGIRTIEKNGRARRPFSFRRAISERPPHLRAQDPHVGLVVADEAPTWNGGCRLLIHEVARRVLDEDVGEAEVERDIWGERPLGAGG